MRFKLVFLVLLYYKFNNLNGYHIASIFQEPIDIAVDNSYGHILVADNGQSCVFVFDSDGKILFQVN